MASSHEIHSRQHGSAADMGAIAILWLTCIVVTNPAGAFPLNDDWAYALSVKYLFEDNGFRPIDWIQALHLSHAAWGYLFALLGGWSDETLRASTLVLSLGGVLAMYLLSRLVGASRAVAAGAALILAFNPIYFALSFTYMTDVPFTALMIITALGFAHSLMRPSDAWLAIAVVAALACTLNRQIGLALPVAYAVAHVMRYGIRVPSIVRAVAPLVICAGVLVGVEQWMAATGRTPALYHGPANALLAALSDPSKLKAAVRGAFVAAVYLGLFLFPLPVLLASQMKSAIDGSGRMVALAYAVFGALAVSLSATAIVKFGQPLPWIGNIIDVAGIGPFTLRDTYILGTRPFAPLPSEFWLAVTICGVVGAALLGSLFLVAASMLRVAWHNREVQPTEAAGVFLVISRP